jgi:hypothetical protein
MTEMRRHEGKDRIGTPTLAGIAVFGDPRKPFVESGKL